MFALGILALVIAIAVSAIAYSQLSNKAEKLKAAEKKYGALASNMVRLLPEMKR